MNSWEFLKHIYHDVNDGYVTLFTKPSGRSYHFPVTELEKMSRQGELLGRRENTYFGLCPHKECPPMGKRGDSSDVLFVSCFGQDFDIKGIAHAEQKLPETKEEILAFLKELPFYPNIIVFTGHGLQAYWLLENPYMITDDEGRMYISRIMSGFERFVHDQASQKGWKFDTVSDLARVLRLPGTLNHKHGESIPCEVIEADDKRYPLSQFESYASYSPEPTLPSEPIEIDPSIIGNAQRIIDKCAFMQHCRDDAAVLPEPEWHAMISNIALTTDGNEAVHELSEPYLGYTHEETEYKYCRAVQQKKPVTCRYICEKLGFSCPENGCGVKSPIAFAMLTKDEQIENLLTGEFTAEDVFSDRVLSLMGYARRQLPAMYARFKLRLRKLGISIRDFERAVSDLEEREQALQFDEIIECEPIAIPELTLHGAVAPLGYEVSLKNGIRKSNVFRNVQVWDTVAADVVLITKRMENVDDGQERMELTYYRNGRFKSVTLPRAAALNKAQLVRYADCGLPVSSGNAEALVAYLAAYEAANRCNIPFIRSINRIGWMGKEFYPYRTDSEIRLETDIANVQQMVGGLTVSGSYDVWKETALQIRKQSFARAILSSSFASPLLELLKLRPFINHFWFDSRGGKTAALKFSLSIFGDPLRLLCSYHATAVGLERSCATMMHLPLGLDELQVLSERRMSIESIVYTLGGGIGKLRGSKTGGMQETLHWRNIILSTGEMPLIKENSFDGVGSRVLELCGRPIETEEEARHIHQVSENHYGHAAKPYIDYLVDQILPEEGKLYDLYLQMREELEKQYKLQVKCEPGIHLDNIAVICLGDYLSSVSVFDMEESEFLRQAYELGQVLLKNNSELQLEDSIQRAWNFVVDWVASNRSRFSCLASRRFGTVTMNKVHIIPSVLRTVLEEAGFSYTKCVRGFVSRGWFDSHVDAEGKRRNQFQCKIDGTNVRVFRCNMDIEEETDSFLN